MARARHKILFFDEAVAFGGSLVVLSYLFKHIDRERFEPKLVSSADAAVLHQLFCDDDVLFRIRPLLHYANRDRWMQRCPSRVRWITKLWAYCFSALSVVANVPMRIALIFTAAKWRPELLHVNNGRDGLLTSRILRIPVVWHIHGINSPSKLRFAPLFPEVKMFICVSEYISIQAQEKLRIEQERIIRIPNPAPAFEPENACRLRLREHYGLNSESVVFVHAGRLVRWKGQLEFLQAFVIVARQYPHVQALIVGEDVEGFTAGYPKQLRAFVQENQLEQRVVFTGHVSNVLEIMAASDVAVHSSIEPEPFGLVITEAMAAGIPVIAAKAGAPAELVEPGVNGLLVDPSETSQFADAMISLIRDSQLRERMGKNGKRQALELYSPSLFAQRIEAVYASVLKQKTND